MSRPPVINGRVHRSFDLSRLTSIGIGGYAQYLVDIFDVRSLKKVMVWIRNNRMRYMVIGSGTNILFPDRGYPGVIIRLAGFFKRIKAVPSGLLVGAGAELKDLILRSIKLDRVGMEPLYGIPGTVGGAIRGNAGAFGKTIGDYVERIWVINHRGEEMMLFKDRIGFSYRKTELDPRLIIMLAEIKLRKGKASLKKALSFEKKRWAKIPKGRSAGCIFKNPPGKSAGKLIEQCGLKGFRIGGVYVSLKHANFILNDGSASYSDVVRLIRIIRNRVKGIGINLELEVKVVR